MFISRSYGGDPTMTLDDLYEQPEDLLLQGITRLKTELADQVLILGHHYQREEVICFADITGDSLKLAQQAAATDAPHIVFCGVHFMAETADILTSDSQKVMLPDPAAGCSMADMANDVQVSRCWQELNTVLVADAMVTPVTYINSTAALKAFCGEHGGIVCTSSNAERIMRWAWGERDKILFFPDQHLGENTAVSMGIADDAMIVWDPALPLGGNTEEAIHHAKLILWKGFCSVHQMFQASHAVTMRQQHSGIHILAHPECSRAVCETADFVGSTEAIINHVHAASEPQHFAIATELNLVNRLRIMHPEHAIYFLSPMVCMCSTMFRTDPQHLFASLQAIADGQQGNRIIVPSAQKEQAKISLQRMLDLG
ncbi:MAG: quinolinate synthase NadA [Mariprofundaceae bacterium]|nr:quinolinate synthase NadA [Mariprofundaceae bacterium]